MKFSKESVFSELNNLEVITTTSEKYCLDFGFTENEVLQALKESGLSDQAENVRKWYANTSSNRLIGNLIQKGSPGVKMIMEDLLQGKHFRMNIDEQIVFDQLDENTEAIRSLFLAGGYLKVTEYEICDSETGADDVIYNDFIKALLDDDKKAIIPEHNIFL